MSDPAGAGAGPELCEKYGVYIISDEVWADFVFAPAWQIATALATDRTRSHTIATYGATQNFNLAGPCGQPIPSCTMTSCGPPIRKVQ